MFSHLSIMLVVAAVLGVVVAGLAIPFAGVLGFASQKVSDGVDDLPQEFDTTNLPQRTEILDRKGKVIASVFDQNRQNVALSAISPRMIKAQLAIEDYRFYQHGALDVKGTMRAFVTNQAADGVVQGGSSITQQLVKLTLVNQAKTKEERAAATDDSYARKIRELRYAIALEAKYTKDQILEQYLNIAYYGDGAYGVQAAAKHYYNVNARALDLNQAATLAGLVQNPTSFDPTNHPDRAIRRRNLVLDTMAGLSVISQKKADRFKAKKLGLDTQPSDNGCVNSLAPFFCDYVLSYLKKDPSLGKNEEERKRLIYSGGLKIHTTIGLRFQKAAQSAVEDHVYPKDQAIGALAMVEPRTGEVRAIAQSRPMGRNKAAGETFLNYVVPREYGDSNGFQAGSTFKPFTLAAAIEQGIPLTKSIYAPPQVFLPENSFETCDGPYASNGTWSPQNSTGSGTFTLYTGTQESVNTFYAQLEQMTGLCDPVKLAKSMGIRLGADGTDPMVPSFTLGVADVSPLEMAEAYATFAGRGLHCAAHPVTSIDDNRGNELKKYRPQCEQVMPGPVADAVNDVLKGVNDPGGFGYDISLQDRDDAGKTGTISDNKAVWFVGYTPNLATAAMVAGANRFGTQITLNGQRVGPSTIATAFGSTVAGPIWGQAMNAIAKYLPPTSFTEPSGIDVAGILTSVPSVSGLSLEAAQQRIEEAGFIAQLGDYVDSSAARGTAVYTGPGTGTQLSSGDSVYIYVSDGTPPPAEKPKKGKGQKGR